MLASHWQAFFIHYIPLMFSLSPFKKTVHLCKPRLFVLALSRFVSIEWNRNSLYMNHGISKVPVLFYFCGTRLGYDFSEKTYVICIALILQKLYKPAPSTLSSSFMISICWGQAASHAPHFIQSTALFLFWPSTNHFAWFFALSISPNKVSMFIAPKDPDMPISMGQTDAQ